MKIKDNQEYDQYLGSQYLTTPSDTLPDYIESFNKESEQAHIKSFIKLFKEDSEQAENTSPQKQNPNSGYAVIEKTSLEDLMKAMASLGLINTAAAGPALFAPAPQQPAPQAAPQQPAPQAAPQQPAPQTPTTSNRPARNKP